VAKLGEAEVLLNSGIKGVLITSPVVTKVKINRLIACVKQDPTLIVVVDNSTTATYLQQAAEASHVKVNVLVDMAPEVLKRTGVLPSGALPLARHIATLSNLRLRGVQCYGGHLQHITSFKERRELSLELMNQGKKVVDELIDAKLLSKSDYIYTGSGTGTHDIDVEVNGLTDMQVGSYVMMDVEYLTVGSKEHETKFSSTFAAPPLTILGSVICANHAPEKVTIDTGFKAIYKDGPPAEVVYPPELKKAEFAWAGDEHGFLYLPPECKLSSSALLGQTVEMIVSHCDPTVNLFDHLYLTQHGKIIDVWEIDMRGKTQ